MNDLHRVMELLDQDRFAAWLSEFEPQDHPCVPDETDFVDHACPLRVYLRPHIAEVHVGSRNVYLIGPTVESVAYPLPDWAARFVQLVDGRVYDGRQWEDLTTAELQEIMGAL